MVGWDIIQPSFYIRFIFLEHSQPKPRFPLSLFLLLRFRLFRVEIGKVHRFVSYSRFSRLYSPGWAIETDATGQRELKRVEKRKQLTKVCKLWGG